MQINASNYNPFGNFTQSSGKSTPAQPITQPKNTQEQASIAVSASQKATNNTNFSDNSSTNDKIPTDNPKTLNAQTLEPSELKQVESLKARDAEVRAHEAAHLAAAGKHAVSGASFEYTRGPDGRSYATGGEVKIDTSPVPNNPEATLQKAQQIQAAAQAPMNPSAQDRQVAAQAAIMVSEASAEMMEAKMAAGPEKEKAENNHDEKTEKYESVERMTEGNGSSIIDLMT